MKITSKKAVGICRNVYCFFIRRNGNVGEFTFINGVTCKNIVAHDASFSRSNDGTDKTVCDAER